MSAANKLARLAASALALAAAWPAHAQGVEFNLTEAPEPDSMAWEDPARVSFTIDPDGEDKFSVQMNLEAALAITPPTADRQKSIKGFIVWNRETGGDDRQNNFEAGGAFNIDYSTAPLDRPEETSDAQRRHEDDRRARRLDFATRLSAAYARTAQYADEADPACGAEPLPPQCRTQFKESLRTGAAFNLLTFHQEQNAGDAFGFSIEPQAGIDHDLLLNNPVDAETGERMKGGYLSATAGAALSVVPQFASPDWEIEVSGRLRQRLAVSDSRAESIEKSAFLFSASATYYVVKPADDDGWRAGIGITYTRGSDPLRGVDDINRIVLALRIGRY